MIGCLQSVISLRWSRSIHQDEIDHVGVDAGLKEDQCMPGSRQTILLVDHSLLGMRIFGFEAMLGMYNTRVWILYRSLIV